MDGEGAGCLLLIGVIIMAIAAGHLLGAARGWLLFGLALVVMALLSAYKRQ